jgi:hypothetical protein
LLSIQHTRPISSSKFINTLMKQPRLRLDIMESIEQYLFAIGKRSAKWKSFINGSKHGKTLIMLKNVELNKSTKFRQLSLLQWSRVELFYVFLLEFSISISKINRTIWG